ncbi:MAG: N-acetylmuramoyl-L-alanine amidase [Desulfobacterium sp.]|nr:N-acetylmuramoyl-L-alanine amidase [Desulfobacteraceae bacterium]MBA3036758.1 N-acetylmuramoyl-L-alanine amidase [Desulfobacterium sp.]
MGLRPLSSIKKIILHCSDSDFGDVALIDSWHKARGWTGCGYHYVITNGVTDHGKPFNPKMDGIIQQGRQLREIGAHCADQNLDSVGICLIGRHHFTALQLYSALPTVVHILGEFGLTWDNVYGHYEFNSGKTCPNMDMKMVRAAMYGKSRIKP